jgi:hypothetical protein
MKHWEHRKEGNWTAFHFNQPYARGLQRLREDVLDKTDFDPAVLWQWGTMQAMSVIEILKDCEKEFGAKGQQVVNGALRRVGHDVGSQLFAGIKKPEGLSEAEIVSFFTTIVNRIAYASLEDPRIESGERISFDILWCPPPGPLFRLRLPHPALPGAGHAGCPVRNRLDQPRLAG